MKIEFYKTEEKAPPKDGTAILGIFIEEYEDNDYTYATICRWRSNLKAWAYHQSFRRYLKKNPVYWTEIKNFEKD